jgi:viroplasmin and RNaseH domain-containing protein
MWSREVFLEKVERSKRFLFNSVKMASTTLSISKYQVLSLYRGLLKLAKAKVSLPGNKDALFKPYITKQFKENKNLKEESKIFHLYNNGLDTIRVFYAAEEQLVSDPKIIIFCYF